MERYQKQRDLPWCEISWSAIGNSVFYRGVRFHGALLVTVSYHGVRCHGSPWCELTQTTVGYSVSYHGVR